MRFEFGGHVEKMLIAGMQHGADCVSDALVFFGATGDLAYKKIFPALQAHDPARYARMPVIGVAKAGWTLEQLKARARDSLEKHGGVDDAGVRQALRAAPLHRRRLWRPRHVHQLAADAWVARAHPLHYLAIPPSMFETVVAAARRDAAVRRGRGSWWRSRSGATSRRRGS